eukprot:362279-Chlamydomonas_euryale.AAC.2
MVALGDAGWRRAAHDSHMAVYGSALPRPALAHPSMPCHTPCPAHTAHPGTPGPCAMPRCATMPCAASSPSA